MRSNDLLQWHNMQISLTVEHKRRTDSKEAHDNVISNVDALSKVLKGKCAKRKGSALRLPNKTITVDELLPLIEMLHIKTTPSNT